MNELTTYRRKERIGSMSDRIAFYTPVTERTVIGGEKITWLLWVTVWADVQNKKANEEYAADRRTAFNTKTFVARKQSLAGVNEKMILQYNSEQYDIEVIDPVQDGPSRSYYQIIATRRDETVTTVEFLENSLYMAFAQKNTSFSGTDWTVTAGTLPDTGTISEEDIHQRCYLFRSGLRMVYGTDYTIEAGNVVRFTQKCRSEVLLFHQYNPI